MRPVDLVILWLGAYRLWWLVSKDTLTRPLRTRLLGYEDNGSKNRWPRSHIRIGEFIHCAWCLGFWISLAVTLAYIEWPHTSRWVILPFAVSSLVGLTFAVFERVTRK